MLPVPRLRRVADGRDSVHMPPSAIGTSPAPPAVSPGSRSPRGPVAAAIAGSHGGRGSPGPASCRKEGEAWEREHVVRQGPGKRALMRYDARARAAMARTCSHHPHPLTSSAVALLRVPSTVEVLARAPSSRRNARARSLPESRTTYPQRRCASRAAAACKRATTSLRRVVTAPPQPVARTHVCAIATVVGYTDEGGDTGTRPPSISRERDRRAIAQWSLFLARAVYGRVDGQWRRL